MRRSRMPPCRPGRTGFFLADAVIGLALLAILSVALISIVRRERRAATVLSDQREATGAAEAVLSGLQARLPPAPGTDVRLTPSPGGDPVAGQAWVEVRATVRGRSASVVGLVPEDALPAHAAPAPQPTKGAP